MSGKNVKIILEDKRMINHNTETAFKIKKVTNSIDYKVGSYLSERNIKDALMDPFITVEIV